MTDHFQYNDSHNREMKNIRTCKEIRLKNLYNTRIVSTLAFIKLLINEESFEKSIYFDRNFKYLF